MGSILTQQNPTSSAGLMPFHFEGRQVRATIDDDGTAWFVAQDACEVLDIGTDQTRRLDADEKGLRSIQTPSGAQQMVVVNEPGLYALVFGSRKPEAKAFKRWIRHEVLPAIRQTGVYTLPAAPALPNFLDPVAAARAWADVEEQKQRLQVELAAAAPAVEFVGRYVQSTGLMTFRQVAKLLKVKEPEFRQFLHSEKIMYPLNGEWTAHAQHIEAGRFRVCAGTAANSHAYSAAKFTPKGVEWVAGELAKWQLKQREEGGHV